MKRESMKVGMRVVAYEGAQKYTGTIDRIHSTDFAYVSKDSSDMVSFCHRRQLVPLVKKRRREWAGDWRYIPEMERWVFIPFIGDEILEACHVTLIERKQPKEKT